MSEVRLTDICSPKQWKTISSEQLTDEGYPVYGANGIIGKYPEYNHDAPVITIACRGTCGTVHITQERSYVTGNAMCLDDLRSDVNLEYLFYLLRHYNFSSIISGTSQPQITQQGLAKVIIRLEPPDRQALIAGTLKKVEAVLKVRQAQLTALEELVKCRFVEMFGDPIIFEKCKHLPQLGEICCLRAGQFVKANDIQTERSEGLYPCFGGNGRRGYVSDYTHDGDYPVIGRQGALCGNVQFVRGKFHATEHAVVVTPRIKMDRCWLYHLLKILNLNRYAIGAAQPGLAVCKLEKIHIQMSDLNEQSQFSHFYRQCDKLRFVSCFSSDKRPRVWALVSLSRPLRKAYTLPYLKEEGMMMEC